MPAVQANQQEVVSRESTPSLSENCRCSSSSATGKRSAVACQRCNQRKTRCTAGEGMPCVGCANAHVQCVLIKSNRGKYARKNRAKSRRSSTEAPVPCPQTETSNLNTLQEQPSDEETALDEEEDVPETLHARIAQGVGRQQNGPADTGKLVFLGEAFSLTYVVHDVLAPFFAPAPNYERRLHFHLDSRGAGRAAGEARAVSTSQQREYLKKQGLLFMLPTNVLGQLLETFFSSFHPVFPILGPVQLTPEAQKGEVSLLVLNAVLLIAISICDKATLRAAGFQDQRYSGRAIFYSQAHALHNADLEPEKISTLVGMFFMSFWWGGPDEVKDSFHWLGVAANLAQALGLHRSTRNSGMDAATTRRWKRIWWAIRTRDTLVSGSIGRPQHINGNDCDVEVLEESDVTEVLSSSEERRLYSCQMARLNEISKYSLRVILQ
ncbi:uncharacterized protein E0L32_008599 [Thyridium curvatum]|uniref:Zn(2)-C6 fungal-type domain-containing protein n=1 Tax=Thyridium curvatum TaxID=1093900 RepID=A0A507B1F1_9PEZI|nr:uncharacterized protein E0L32_008599 [Thyridium curvatum]TPX10380.1 hypothetical protein E0L32_008599 [Thyridium curvatum]